MQFRQLFYFFFINVVKSIEMLPLVYVDVCSGFKEIFCVMEKAVPAKLPEDHKSKWFI